MSRRLIFLFLFGAAWVSPAFGQVTVTDATIEEGQTYTMTADTEYILDGFVFVERGAVLNIEPGTVIRGRQIPTTGDNASALIIARGGAIYANGAPANPIIFTAEVDNLNDSNDLTWKDRGLWGGVILLGRATTNRGVEGQIEGIPSGETRAAYGGDDDHDNSGVMRYVSIRHGGAELGPGDEINGLTFGAVGSRTVVEYIEVFSNLDDGYEWFGGTVNTRNLVAAFCGDDSFDYDEGWRGKNQFWFAIQGPDSAGRIGEHDGGTIQETAPPFATPYIYNATYIGPGVNNIPQGDGSEAIIFRDNAGGHYGNSIFTEYTGANDGKGLTIEDLEGEGDDSRIRMENGDLTLTSNIWWGFGNGDTLGAIADQNFVQDHLTSNKNQIVDPQLRGVSRDNDGGLDPRPAASGAAANGAAKPPSPFFMSVDYYGAFDPNVGPWTLGWTALSQNGHTGTHTTVINDQSIEAGQTLTLTPDRAYLLDGFVFVEADAKLVIEPGTVIKARMQPTTGDNASALIIARGGQIFAQGTADKPIIFTAELDEIEDPTDLTWEDRGLWGGLIVLGRATTNRGVEGQIEGIPSGEARAAYGGDDDNDNSGVLRHVSIRHGGAELGPGDEINGLTMGAVGSQTVVEYVEVFSNLDDGFEWFGGTVNTKYLVAAFCGDDGFDYDEGWRGKNQFWFAIQGPDSAGRIGEHDGGSIQETAPPFATPHILNATYIGPGVGNFPQGDGSEALIFRDNAGGRYANSIITDYNGANDGKAITIEDLDGGDDSRIRLENKDLLISNNLWWGFGNGNSLDAISDQDFVREHLAQNDNRILNPLLRSISREADGGLDPRPAALAAASGATTNVDPFFNNVAYYGAFNPQSPLWLNGWTALAHDNHLATSEKRWIAHVTRAGGGFQTTVHFRNIGARATTVTLRPYDAAGKTLTERTLNIGDGESRAYTTSELFGGEEVSHFSIQGASDCLVTASYKAASGAGASAELNESDSPRTRWSIYQGEWDVVFDGLALVNVSNAPASVTLTQIDPSGETSATLTQNLGPGAKMLAVFDTSFESKAGSRMVVESSQPAIPVFLRGTRPGVSPGYLYVTNPGH